MKATAKPAATPKPIVQVTSRGAVTLPPSVREALAVRPGDPLVVSIEGGRIVLAPAVVLPVEIYSEERVRDFDRASKLTPHEARAARKRWGL